MAGERSDQAQPAREQRSSQLKPLLYLVFVLLALGALYALVKPRHPVERPGAAEVVAAEARVAPSPAAAPASPATEPARAVSAKPNILDIVVQRGRRISEPAVIKVHEGDEVTLHITTDRADELHLHGYNLHVQVSPEKTAVLQFTAKLTGRFPYELHKSELELGAVEVYPQ
jgi:hypothetical protein